MKPPLARWPSPRTSATLRVALPAVLVIVPATVAV
jgi:hypothetical protein